MSEQNIDELNEFVDEAYWIIRKTFFGVGVSQRRMDAWLQRWLDAGRDCAPFLPEPDAAPVVSPSELHEELRAHRRRCGLTQMHVAEQLGIARTTLIAIEKGERQLRAPELVQLAHLYGIQVADLLMGTQEVQP